eukprot:TRINITY_DN11537_c0_g1_i1.p1 TRINITY_DN11537_c0_g1~~TRINITY_DN11537_c0_g1_i1.p1  ORF type:complete len:938 (-),score=317.01 TRINITY_DN11537_c0_g1_i1:21-2834(-)
MPSRQSYRLHASHGVLADGGVRSVRHGTALAFNMQHAASINVADAAVTAWYTPDGSEVTSCCLTSSADRVIVATMARRVYVFNVPKKTEVEEIGEEKEQKNEKKDTIPRLTEKDAIRSWTFPPGTFATSMDCDFTSTLVAIGGTDGTVRVYDIEGGFCTHTLRGHNNVVTLCLFHPIPSRASGTTGKSGKRKSTGEDEGHDHLLLYAAASDGDFKRWDLITKQSCDLKNHTSTVSAIGFSSKGEYMVTAGRDNIMSLWSLKEGKVPSLAGTIPTFEAIEGVMFVSASSLPIENYSYHEAILSAGEGGILKAWSLSGNMVWSTQKKLTTSEGETELVPLKYTNLFSCDGLIWLCDIEQRMTALSPPEMKVEKIIVGNRGDITDLSYIPEKESGKGDSLLVITNSEQAELFPMKGGNSELLEGHTGIILCCAIDCRQERIATAGKDHTIRVWDIATRKCVAICEGHTEAVGAVAFGLKRQGLLVSSSKDTTIKRWALDSIEASLTSAAETGEEVEILRPQSEITVAAHSKEINTVALSPNDKLIATGSQDKTIKLWNTADLSLSGTLSGHKRGVWCVQFSPVDQAVLSSSSDMTIRIWSIATMTCLKIFEGSGSSVLRCSFITKGTQVISGSTDGVLKLWDVKTTECLKTIEAHEDKLWSVAVKNDGEMIITGGGDAALNIWEDSTTQEQEEKKKEEDDRIVREQELNNLLHRKRFWRALQVALELNHSRDVLRILEAVHSDHMAGLSTVSTENGAPPRTVKDMIRALEKEQIAKVFGHSVDWATTSKHSAIAHEVISAVLLGHTYQQLKEFCPHLKNHLEALLPYTERSFKQADRLIQKSYIIDYTLARMERNFAPISESELKDDEEHEQEFQKILDQFEKLKEQEQQELEQDEDDDIIYREEEVEMEKEKEKEEEEEEEEEEVIVKSKRTHKNKSKK